MANYFIQSVSSCDARFLLPQGAGSDSVHTNSEYSLAVTLLNTEYGPRRTGSALTPGEGNRLGCEAIDLLARPLAGRDIAKLIADFCAFSRDLSLIPRSC